jgi:tetratricopeptide (TPR) repeat protein
MKHAARLIAFLLVLSCSNTSEVKEVNFENLTLDEAFAKARQENKLVMVDFFSTTCMPCWNLLKTVFQDKEYSRYINEHFISVKITSEEEGSQKLKSEYQVWGLPTVIFFDPTGVEIDRNCGYDGKKDKYFQTIKDYVAGKNTLQQLLKNYASDSLNVNNNFLLAKKYINRWENKKSERYFQNVLALDVNDRHGNNEEAELHLACSKTRYDKDESQLLGFIGKSTNKNFLTIGYDYLLNFYQEKGDTAKYVASCNAAIERMPEIDVAYWRLANLYKKNKEATMYLSLCRQAAANIPDNPDYLNRYAWAIYENKLSDKYEEAISLAEKAVKLKPDAANIWDALGWLYCETGDMPKAIKAMEKAVKINPQREYYKINLEKFKSMQK